MPLTLPVTIPTLRLGRSVNHLRISALVAVSSWYFFHGPERRMLALVRAVSPAAGAPTVLDPVNRYHTPSLLRVAQGCLERAGWRGAFLVATISRVTDLFHHVTYLVLRLCLGAFGGGALLLPRGRRPFDLILEPAFVADRLSPPVPAYIRKGTYTRRVRRSAGMAPWATLQPSALFVGCTTAHPGGLQQPLTVMRRWDGPRITRHTQPVFSAPLLARLVSSWRQ